MHSRIAKPELLKYNVIFLRHTLRERELVAMVTNSRADLRVD